MTNIVQNIDLTDKEYFGVDVAIERWLVKNDSNLKDTNPEFNLKTGDLITFRGGYNDDIAYTSKIIAFDAESGDAYVRWDCYWLGLDLKRRLLPISNSGSNRIQGYYWCKLDGKWDIFSWCDGWYDGMCNMYNESDFEDIDEKTITRE